MDLPSQNPQVSSDLETKGFDLSAGGTWIYPENYPIRDYQYDIVQAALYSNTLVCLPTGLGKTFIAAVVMYNFWRWYPRGKVVFLAPTKPLVAQQIYACHNVMGIPGTETVELTGAVNQKQREIAWFKKRVVFATPQVFHNDLEKNIVPGDLVKCVVIDEAHKALGKHSYCECIRILGKKNEYFRILALSATPGNKIDSVHEVLQNLRVARMELRDETSPDVARYVNQRKIDIILVPLSDELTKYKERYIVIMDRHVKVLLRFNVLQSQAANISKGRIFHIFKEFQKKGNKSGNYGQIMKTLNILVTMYHAYDLMIRDGLRAFYKFYQNHADKFWMNDEIQLQELLQDIQTYLGPFPSSKSLGEESVSDIPQDLVFGHTKFGRLRELLLRHFRERKENQDDSRAIVFVEYRDIVSEVYILLLQSRPLIRPQMFVGQSGQTQKQQIEALENFRNNRVNVLISTSIGEEGLDVGEVDLIICFDISQHSPTRLVQRMGRTGRKRDGHIIILVTDGREHEMLKSTIARRDSLNQKILHSSNIFSSLYQYNPRMIPEMFKPECHKMHINVQPKTPITKIKGKKGKAGKKEEKNQKQKEAIPNGTSVESKEVPSKLGTQLSMAKFCCSEKFEEPAEVFKTSLKTPDANNVCDTITMSDVKILSRDNEGIDFLTMCTIKRSEKDATRERSTHDFEKRYLPIAPTIKNFFKFSIPDSKVLDCLVTLKDATPRKRETKVMPKNDNDNDENDKRDGKESSIDTDLSTIAFSPTGIDYEKIVAESRFEDLMDESSKSSCSETSNRSPGNSDVEKRRALAKTIAPDVPPLKDISIEHGEKPRHSQPGIFEDILDDSSDSFENEDVSARVSSFKFTESNDPKIPADGTISGKTVKIGEGGKEGAVGEARAIEVRGKDTMLNVESKLRDESMLGITQALNEIARINSMTDAQRRDDREDEESETDMFEDETLEGRIGDEKMEFNWKDSGEDDGLPRKEKPVREETHSEARDRLRSSDLTEADGAFAEDYGIKDCEWSDEFGISPTPIGRALCFENKQRFSKTVNVERQSWSDRGWISVEKSLDATRNSGSSVAGTSIAKKLANVRRLSNMKSRISRSRFDDTENTNVEFVANTKDAGQADKNGNASYFYDSMSSNVSRARSSRDVTDRPRKSKRRRRKSPGFVFEEAEGSPNDSSDVSFASDEDFDDLGDFVSYTQHVADTTDMHAHYLRTVRSPVKRHGAFLFKKPRSTDFNVDVYSQSSSHADETYVNDTFCVAGDEKEDESEVQSNESFRSEDLSVLEKAEQALEERKRKRSRRGQAEDVSRRKKKRRNVRNESSSSEDETERLRAQVRDESFLLRAGAGHRS